MFNVYEITGNIYSIVFKWMEFIRSSSSSKIKNAYWQR